MWNKQTKKTETQCFVETFRSTIISRLWNGIGWKYKNKRALKMPHCSGHWFIGKGTEPIQKQAPVQKHRPRLVPGRGHWGWPSLHHSFELSNQTQSRLEKHFRTSFYRYAGLVFYNTHALIRISCPTGTGPLHWTQQVLYGGRQVIDKHNPWSTVRNVTQEPRGWMQWNNKEWTEPRWNQRGGSVKGCRIIHPKHRLWWVNVHVLREHGLDCSRRPF